MLNSNQSVFLHFRGSKIWRTIWQVHLGAGVNVMNTEFGGLRRQILYLSSWVTAQVGKTSILEQESIL
jgi:hypothetical protein